jgi:hypothetical protein
MEGRFQQIEFRLKKQDSVDDTDSAQVFRFEHRAERGLQREKTSGFRPARRALFRARAAGRPICRTGTELLVADTPSPE